MIMIHRCVRFLKRAVKILGESLRGFVQDQCYLHASSLTFYTLLSIVPLLAVTFGLAKGFGFEQNLEFMLQKWFSEHAEVLAYAVEFSRSLLAQAEGSYIAGVGVVFLFLFVLSLFWTIEASMNAIWKVKRSRPPLRMLTDYLAMMVICPFFLVIASSLTLFVASQINIVVEQHEVLRKMSPLLSLFYRSVTLITIWILFACIYLIMPNHRVKAKYALSSAVMSGTLYYLMLIAMINFQIGVSQYNAIYGSFAALPLFLLWLQISWLLVLMGAEIAYHAEHLSPALGNTKKSVEVSLQVFTVLLVHKIVELFKSGEKPWSLVRFSEYYCVPEAVIKNSFEPLVKQGLVTSIKSDNSIVSYQPARELKTITIHEVVQACNPSAHKTIQVSHSSEVEEVTKSIEEYILDAERGHGNIAVNQLE